MSIDDAGPRLHKAAHYARRALGDPRALVLSGTPFRSVPDAHVAVDAEKFERCATQASRYPRPRSGRIDRLRPPLVDRLDRRTPAGRPVRGVAGGSARPVAAASSRAAPASRPLGGARPWPTRPTRRPASPAPGSWRTAATERAALRQLERLERALRRELGVSPGPAVASLRAELLASDASHAQRAPGDGFPFGREAELAPARPVDRRGRRGSGTDALRVRACRHRQDRRAAVARPARRGAGSACGRRCCRRPGGCLAVRAGAGGSRGSVPALPGAARWPGRRVPDRDRGCAARQLGRVGWREPSPAAVRQRRRAAAACFRRATARCSWSTTRTTPTRRVSGCCTISPASLSASALLIVVAHRPWPLRPSLDTMRRSLIGRGTSLPLDLGPLSDDDIWRLARPAVADDRGAT